MGKISAHTTTRHLGLDGIQGHYGTLAGFTVGFESYEHDEDPTPLFSGLPDNACQAHHWGVVLEGTMVFRHTDGTTDIINAGEAYYVLPGHLPRFKAGTRLIQFSPTDEFAKTMAVVSANADAMRAG